MASAVDEIRDLFREFGRSAYDEDVTLEQHSIQTAALASAGGASDELVVAALLHDIGHLLQARSRGDENYLASDWDHDRVAASWLRPRFGALVADPVGHHVSAKRWLCAVEPSYFETLSPASMASLEVQGGAFDPTAAAAWIALPGAEDAVALRRWDDDGKVGGLEIPPLEHFLAVAQCVSSS